METCYSNCLQLFMATKRVSVLIPTVPYMLADFNGFEILMVDPPFFIEYIGGEPHINGPTECCGQIAHLTINYTDCAIEGFRARISNYLGVVKCLVLSIKDGTIVNFNSIADECADVEKIFHLCGECGCESHHFQIDCGSSVDLHGGTANLPDGRYKVFYNALADITGLKYANLLELLVKQYEFEQYGAVISQSTSHGKRSTSTTRKDPQYDVLIEKELQRHRNNVPVMIFRGTRGCRCRGKGRKALRWKCA